MDGIIYKTTCLINGKIYIGQSLYLNRNNYLGSGVKLLLSIKLYGKENFKKEILKSGIKSQKKLDLWESIFIKKFDSCNSEIGYNILPGTANDFGSGSPMLIPEIALKSSKIQKIRFKENPNLGNSISKRQKIYFMKKENREKISKKLKGRYKGDKNPNFGNTWTEEQKKHLSEKMKGRYDGKKNPNFGNNWTQEQKENLRKKQKGKYEGEKNPMFGKKRITDGKVNKIIDKSESLPDGFRYGLTRGLK